MCVVSPSASDSASSRRAPWSAHQLVAARAFDLRGQREWAGDLHLHQAGVVGEQILGGIEILRQQ